MGTGRIAVVALVVAVLGGAWAATTLIGGDDTPGAVEAVVLDEVRKQEAAELDDVAEDDDEPRGPDPTGDAVRGDDAMRGGGDGLGADRVVVSDGTGGSTLEDGLRRELVRERALSNALRAQLASERRATDTGGSAAAAAPAPAPAPSVRWGGGGTSSGGGGDT